MLWLRKLVAVLSISLGISLLLLPFPDRLSGNRDQEVVWLEVTRTDASDEPLLEKVPQVTGAELAPYPALATAVELLSTGEVPREVRVDVAPGELRRFHRVALDDRGLRPTFAVGDLIFLGGVMNEPVGWTQETPWLAGAGRAVGAVALLLGLALAVASYHGAGSRAGILVAPVAFAMFCDLVLVAGGVFAVAVTIDAAWVKLLAQPSLIGLDPEWPSAQTFSGLHFVALLALVVMLPLLTLIFTSLSAQRVRIDGDGVTSLGAIGSTSITWEDLERVQLRDQRNPTGFTVNDFRNLQRVLELAGADRTVTINEPTSQARKQAIPSALRRHAPPARQHLIEQLGAW